MRTPGTSTILRTLTETQNKPRYALIYRRFQQRRTSPPPRPQPIASSWFGTLFGSCLMRLGIYVLLPLPICMTCLVLTELSWSFGLDQATLVPIASAAGLLVIGGSLTLIASRISRAIAIERAHHTWDMLLLLPHDRYRMILYSVAHAHRPQVALLGLALTEFAAFALLIGNPSALIPLLAFGLLAIEWTQLLALSITVGIVSAGARFQDLRGVIALVWGMGVIVLRAGGGWLAVNGFGLARGNLLPALVAGPLSWLAAPGAGAMAWALAALYLLALEVLVRGLFAWAVAHAGEA